jgi:hypothetical protein
MSLDPSYNYGEGQPLVARMNGFRKYWNYHPRFIKQIYKIVQNLLLSLILSKFYEYWYILCGTKFSPVFGNILEISDEK